MRAICMFDDSGYFRRSKKKHLPTANTTARRIRVNGSEGMHGSMGRDGGKGGDVHVSCLMRIR
eukprot:1933623-Pleurochrysis_carterae.AAC.2